MQDYVSRLDKAGLFALVALVNGHLEKRDEQHKAVQKTLCTSSEASESDKPGVPLSLYDDMNVQTNTQTNDHDQGINMIWGCIILATPCTPSIHLHLCAPYRTLALPCIHLHPIASLDRFASFCIHLNSCAFICLHLHPFASFCIDLHRFASLRIPLFASGPFAPLCTPLHPFASL
jgi:hypothetical protein